MCLYKLVKEGTKKKNNKKTKNKNNNKKKTKTKQSNAKPLTEREHRELLCARVYAHERVCFVCASIRSSPLCALLCCEKLTHIAYVEFFVVDCMCLYQS